MAIRLVKGNRTIAVAETLEISSAGGAKVVEEDQVFDVSAREGPLDLSSDRPAGRCLVLTLEGTGGPTVVESICIWYGFKTADFWVRRLSGPWPTPDELVDLVAGTSRNFGGTVDRRSDDVALVGVNID